MKRFWPVLLFALLHGVIFMVILGGAFPDRAVTDSRPLYFSYASGIFNGRLPYQDFPIEYPPFSLVIFILPRLLAHSSFSYSIAFSTEMLIFDLIGLALIAALMRHLRHSVWGGLTVYTLALLAIGIYVPTHFDLVPAILVLFALYAFARGWNIISWVTLALGVMTKIYPIVVIPLITIYLLQHRDHQKLKEGILAFTGTIILISIPCVLISPHGFYESFTYHSYRGLQIESTYASLLFLADTWGIISTETGFGYGAYNITTQLADTIAKLTPMIMALALAAVYGLYARKQWHKSQPDERAEISLLIRYATVAILVFLLTNKVLSPQYIIWLYPLVPLIAGQWRIISLAIFFIIGLLTRYIYPDHYSSLINGEPKLTYILAGRNLLIFSMAILLQREKLPTAGKGAPDT